MTYRVLFAPEARDDYLVLPAHKRAEVRDAVNRHLQHELRKTSRSRIKRLRGTSRPQYRLRIGDVRVFYDVQADRVEVLGIVDRAHAAEWLNRTGVYDEDNRPG